jgi:predicted metal-binding protein
MKAKSDSFEAYSRDGFELVGFGHCNECCKTSPADIAARAESMKKAGVDTIHIGSCIKRNCPNYTEFIEILSKEFTVVGHTHALR